MFIQGFRSYFNPNLEQPDLIAAWTGLFSAVVIYLVYRYNKKLAIKTKSHALMAAAQDNRSDAWVSVGASVGIIGAQYNVPWLDPVMAQIVAIMIIKTAFEIFSDASHSLSDGYSEETLMKYKHTMETIPGVEAVHDIKARTHGSNVLIDVTIHVNPKLDVISSHEITNEIEQKLKNSIM